MLKRYLLIFTTGLLSANAKAQHEHMHPPESKPTSDTSQHVLEHNDIVHAKGNRHDGMSSALSPVLPMNRNGSGTSWIPDASPVYGYMSHEKKWMLMFMGNIFGRYNKQDIGNKGIRGGSKWDAPNMLMAMAQRQVGKKGLFHANFMLSTDALIAGGEGYPLLFQTGESWKGQPLTDRQHPHDLFSELSVSYAYSFSAKSDAYVYIGYPGEPALGPPTFMHRPPGNFIPDAPIGHHWQDATHITFGVVTMGYRYGKLKIEGSGFNGREPDENRYDFDKPRMDSWSGRLWLNPNEHWSLQVSHGYLKSPEALHPDENIHRSTGSATYVYRTKSKNILAATAAIGRNKLMEEKASYSILLEGIYKMQKLAVYTRGEAVQKSGEELNLSAYPYLPHTLYSASAVTGGIAYDLVRVANTVTAVGMQLSINLPDQQLKDLYGTTPISGQVYIHIYPGLLQ